MNKPSHLEMAGWGLLGLLGAALFVHKLGWPGYPAFMFFLPMAAARATRTFNFNIMRAYTVLLTVVLFFSGFSGMVFACDCGSSGQTTWSMLPAFSACVRPYRGPHALFIFFNTFLCVIMCAVTVRLCFRMANNTDALLRTASVFSGLILLHLLLSTRGKPWEPGDAFKTYATVLAIGDLYSIVFIYAGFYVALFYDLVKKSNATK